MKTIKEIKREAKHLFRLCFVDGSLNEDRVRSVVQGLLQSEHRGALTLAWQFQHLVILNRRQHSAEVQSATSLPADLRASVQTNLVAAYGPGLSTSFSENPELIGGMRIRVASDVYDGSVKAGLAALEQRF